MSSGEDNRKRREKYLSLSVLICTMGVVSPPPDIGVRSGGRSAREVPRKVLVWPGLVTGGRDMIDAFSLAVLAPLGLLGSVVAPCGLPSRGLYLHFGPQRPGDLNSGASPRVGTQVHRTPPHCSTSLRVLGRGSAIPGPEQEPLSIF